MAPIERKRRRKDTPVKSKKKRKTEQGNDGTSKREISATTTTLETLRWHEVPFPENFGDAEGFFGLDEVSDVDVVRSSGKAEYKVRQRDNAVQMHDHVVAPTVEEDMWEGFTEDAETEHVHSRPEANLSNNPSTKADSKPTKHSKKKGKRKLPEQDQACTSGNTFDALGEGDEDGEDPDGGDMSAWDPLPLSFETVTSLAHLKFYRPTPIQASALPHVLEGHDAICKAPTGSGKTLVFGIPIFEHCITTRKAQESSQPKGKAELKYNPFALILSPTRELAHQLADHLQQLGSSSDSSPRIATLTGGLSMHKQQRLLPNAEIVIGTPGRLKEVMDGSPALAEALKGIRFLVLDEADRLLSSGHFQELEEILLALDRTKATDGEVENDSQEPSSKQERQTLVFSATFEKDLQQKLAGKSKSSGGGIGGQASMEYLLRKLNFREQKPRFIDINPGSSFPRCSTSSMRALS